MNAVLAQPDRFATFARADLSEPEKERRAAATVRLIARFRQSGRPFMTFRCPICRGRVDVEGQRNAKGALVGSMGVCRTTNCLNWEDCACPHE